MKKKTRLILAIVVTALAGVACLWFLNNETNPQVPAKETRSDRITPDTNESAKSGREKSLRLEERKSRDQALAELKVKWARYLALVKGGADKKEMHFLMYDLKRESANRLLTSQQTLELLAFLEANGGKGAAIHLRLAVKKGIETGDANHFIYALAEAISESYDTASSEAKSDLSNWSFLIGKNGTVGEQRFLESIDKPWLLGNFLHGWYLSQTPSKPVASYTSMVELLKQGGKGAKRSQGLENIIKAFPEDMQIDYESLESMLPINATRTEESTYQKARRALLVRWAKEDPASAVNFIIDHSERMEPLHVTYVVGQAIKDLNYEGIEWVKEFPKGMIYDRSAVAVVQRLRYSEPDIATEWAMSIGDEELRQSQLDKIAASQRPSRTR